MSRGMARIGAVSAQAGPLAGPRELTVKRNAAVVYR